MYKNAIKPFFDFVLALLLMPLLSLIIIIVGLLIKLDDKKSIFYISKRIGENGKLFRMIKFRTMVENAEDVRLEDGSTFNSANDNRVTKIGRFLRKTSLDEVPQIVNILLFQMSFIGPRPDPEDWLERYPKEFKDFLKCKPGITGYNQAYYRNSADGKQKMENDFFYYQNLSFLLDLKIFFKTIIIVCKKENIYKE